MRINAALVVTAWKPYRKNGDALLTDCPACGAAALEKKVTAAAFRLSGGGWYETDFKKDNKKKFSV